MNIATRIHQLATNAAIWDATEDHEPDGSLERLDELLSNYQTVAADVAFHAHAARTYKASYAKAREQLASNVCPVCNADTHALKAGEVCCLYGGIETARTGD